jgi:hypothetical protein
MMIYAFSATLFIYFSFRVNDALFSENQEHNKYENNKFFYFFFRWNMMMIFAIAQKDPNNFSTELLSFFCRSARIYEGRIPPELAPGTCEQAFEPFARYISQARISISVRQAC